MIRVWKIQEEKDLQAAFAIRKKVFVEEQQVPEEEELDEFESISNHFLAEVDGEACGTARWRVTPEGKIKLERFAVLENFRGRGIGEVIVKFVLADLSAGPDSSLGQLPPVYLHAQIQVIPFYERLGFETKGPEFDECGILHRVMYLKK